MDVEWKPVAGYEGLYEVSRDGRVRSLVARPRGSLVSRKKPRLLKDGNSRYKKVVLYKDGRPFAAGVHRLVLEAFVGPCPTGFHGSHLNGDARDCRLENLAWESPSANNKRKSLHGTVPVGDKCPASKLNTLRVEYILQSRESAGDLADLFGVDPSTINKIRRGETWAHIPTERLARESDDGR